MRLHQELVLGIGGVRAIRALGLAPAVWHLNEGHSAFLLAERAREYVAGRASLDDAWTAVRRDSVFTIHTPGLGRQRAVRRRPRPARRRPAARCRRRARSSASSSSGSASTATQTQFDMTAFSLRLTSGANAVSQLHAETANATWQGIIDHADPGHHQRRPRADLDRRADRRAARGPRRRPRRPRREQPRPAGSGSASTRSRRATCGRPTCARSASSRIFARGRLRSQFARHGEAPSVLAELEHALDPDVLTIGFARRFATYKRAGLLFSDIDRLAAAAVATRSARSRSSSRARPTRPTAPASGSSRRSSSARARRSCAAASSSSRTTTCASARFLVQGVDVWLNNPRRPLEASGTSGMKAAQNGVPNVSVLDGWWDEGYDGDNGWAIGGRETDPDEAAQDWRRRPGPVPAPRGGDRPALLRARRGRACRSAGSTSCAGRWRRALWRFSTTRMLHEYTERLYLPAAGVPVVDAPSPAPARAPKPARPPMAPADLARARDPQPPAGRQLRLGLRRGLRAGLRADGRRARAPSRRPAVAPLHRARCSTGCAPNGPTFIERLARARRRATRSRSSAAATTSRSSPRCPSATGSASCAGWATSSRRCSGAGRPAPGWPSGSGSRTCRPRSSRPATTGRSSTTPTSAPRRSPRRTCGARTRPRTRASSCASSGPSRACATGSRSATSRRSSTTCATTPPRTASRVGMMGDDGEKFGAWPTTWEHCWGERRWVDRFFEALEANADWLTTTTPVGLAGRPRADRPRLRPDRLVRRDGRVGAAGRREPGLRGRAPRARRQRTGPRRAGCAARSGATSRSSYREINDLHKQMLRTSDKVDAMPDGADRDARRSTTSTSGQSNDCYWHGLFGGIYISHMRLATLRAPDRGRGPRRHGAPAALDAAERARPRPRRPRRGPPGGPGPGRHGRPDRGRRDRRLGYPGRPPRARRGHAPAARGATTRRSASTRRRRMRRPATADAATVRTRPASIHDIVRTKEPGLADQLHYDPYERRSGLVRFLAPGHDAGGVGDGRAVELGDAVDGRLRDRVARARTGSSSRRATRRCDGRTAPAARPGRQGRSPSAATAARPTLAADGHGREPIRPRRVDARLGHRMDADDARWRRQPVGLAGRSTARGRATTATATATGVDGLAQGNDYIGVAVATTVSEPADAWWAPVETSRTPRPASSASTRAPGCCCPGRSSSRPARRGRRRDHAVTTTRDRARRRSRPSTRRRRRGDGSRPRRPPRPPAA